RRHPQSAQVSGGLTPRYIGAAGSKSARHRDGGHLHLENLEVADVSRAARVRTLHCTHLPQLIQRAAERANRSTGRVAGDRHLLAVLRDIQYPDALGGSVESVVRASGDGLMDPA